MSDFEILDKYIKDRNDDFYYSLSFQEQILYKCQIRNTFSFQLYLVTYRILEFANKITEKLKGEQNE